MEVTDYRAKNRQIEIPISECDIESFWDILYERKTHIDWTFETNDGEPINLKFITETEEE
jgi:hypothetical protein